MQDLGGRRKDRGMGPRQNKCPNFNICFYNLKQKFVIKQESTNFIRCKKITQIYFLNSS